MARNQKGSEPNRIRRAAFAFLVTIGSVTLAYGLAWSGHDTEISRKVADGLIGLADVVGGSYIGASAVDWSAGKISGAMKARKASRDDDEDEDRTPRQASTKAVESRREETAEEMIEK